MQLLTVVCVSQAQTVSTEDALAKAKSLRATVNGVDATKNAAEPLLTYTSKQDDNTLYYVFNYPDGGFAIIGGDKKARDVLGYADSGSFSIDDVPDGLKFMLDCYGEQISAAIDDESVTVGEPAVGATTKTDITPLITTTWNQDDPYNSKIPSLGEGYTGYYALATGCGPTAAAQIMKYYNYPVHGTGSNSYSLTWNSSSGTITRTFQADFANTTYDWDNMLDSYSGSYTTTQSDAVGILMYHVGVAMNAKYGQIAGAGTSVYTTALLPALKNHFGYDNNGKNKNRDSYTDIVWDGMVYDELSAGRPLLYTGQSDSGGHAFICDGYRTSDGNYHFNWGWAGYCDGWYPLTGTGALQPNGSGIGGAGSGAAYTKSQTILAGLQPTKGDVNKDCVVDSTDAEILANAIVHGTTSQLDANLADMNGDGEINITDVVAITMK